MSSTRINIGALSEHFAELNYDKNVDVLVVDLAPGGVHSNFAETVANKGYKTIDLLLVEQTTGQPTPPNEHVRNVHRTKHSGLEDDQEDLGQDVKLSQKYDVTLLLDIFNVHSSRQVKLLEKALSWTKSGGFLCWSMDDLKQLALHDSKQFGDGNFDRYLSMLCDKCKWLSVLGYPEVIRGYTEAGDGLFYAMQVI